MARGEVIRLYGGDDGPPSLWQRVREAVRAITLGPYNTKDPALASLFGGGPVSSGVNITTQTALSVSAFYCAVTTIAADVASLPLVLFKREGRGRERYSDHRLYRLLHDAPNDEMTSFAFRQAWLLNALVFGSGFAEIERDQAGRPAALWPLASSSVQPFRQHGHAPLQYKVHNPSGTVEIFDARDILHLRGPSFDGLAAIDPVRVAREALGLSVAAERFGATFFGNGATFGGIITYPPGVAAGQGGEQTRKENREAIERRHQGVDRAHRLLTLYEGGDYKQLGVNPRDSQFTELRTFQLREIARFFRIPVSMLGDLERSTYSNAEQQQIVYYTSCLRPWLINIEQELAAKLISPLERQQQTIEHIVEGFLRADSEMRATFYARMVAHGIMSVNEIRARENLPPVEGGDAPRVPLNTGPLALESEVA